MDMFKMEEFMDLGDVWGEDQTFDVNHFDDLDVTEAKNGLYDTSVKPKPQADTQVDLLQSLIDAPVGGYLGLEWMEQSNLMHYLQVPVEDGFITTEPVSELLDDNLPLDTQNLALEKSEPHGSSVAFLQSLLEEQEKLIALPLVKTEPTESSVRIESEFPPVTVELPASSAPSSPEAQVSPEIDFSMTGSFDLENVFIGGKVEFVQAPLSPDDVESLLSSASQSPSSSTVDTSSLYSDDNSLICNTSDLYEIVSNEKKKSRAAPYSKQRSTPKNKGRKQTASISPNPSELELELMSKKDRKKLQNKNAAIRYRMKKKEESSVKKTEEEELESINQSLQEKVDELNREIKYMKGLITDVRKARGLPPLVC